MYNVHKITDMPYNKEAIIKYREAHPERFSEISIKANTKYRANNIDAIRERDKLSKRPLATEWRLLRHINLF